MDILFSTGPCVLGRVLVATSERGVCAILLGDDAGNLVRDLRQRPATGLDAPLDLRGSEEVGEACAANVLAVAIPCHRVLRKDGGLAGYRWGVGRKRALLRSEGAFEA